VYESRDKDTEDRNFGPLQVGVAGGVVIDLPIVAQDHGWCFGYTCQKRLSTFWTYVPSEWLALQVPLAMRILTCCTD